MADCIIVGGGIIGLMCALELKRAGVDVLILEQGQVGRESSWAGGGILSPMYPWQYSESLTSLATWSQDRYPKIIAEIKEKTPIDPELIQCGMLLLDAHEVPIGVEWAQKHKVACEIVKKSRIASRWPKVNDTLSNEILWLPDIYQIRNPRLLKALKQYLQNIGIEIKENASVEKIITRKNAAVGVETTKDQYKAPVIVIAAGAWSSKLLSSIGVNLTITPVRGQMILIKCEADFIKMILVHKNQYIIPRRDGHLLVGSTLEDVGFDKTTTKKAFQKLTAAATTMVPALSTFSTIKHWAGLRPNARDGLPFIGPVPPFDGLYVNTGHFRNGLLLAPASAKLLAELIVDQPHSLDPTPFALN